MDSIDESSHRKYEMSRYLQVENIPLSHALICTYLSTDNEMIITDCIKDALNCEYSITE